MATKAVPVASRVVPVASRALVVPVANLIVFIANGADPVASPAIHEIGLVLCVLTKKDHHVGNEH